MQNEHASGLYVYYMVPFGYFGMLRVNKHKIKLGATLDKVHMTRYAAPGLWIT